MDIYIGLYACKYRACQGEEHRRHEMNEWNEKLYLHTVKLLCDPGRVLDFEQGV